MKKQIMKPEVRDRIKYLSSDQFGVDEKKRPAAVDVPQASFRKLNIDWFFRLKRPAVGLNVTIQHCVACFVNNWTNL